MARGARQGSLTRSWRHTCTFNIQLYLSSWSSVTERQTSENVKRRKKWDSQFVCADVPKPSKSRSSLMTRSSSESPGEPFTVIFSPSLLMKWTVTLLSDLKHTDSSVLASAQNWLTPCCPLVVRGTSTTGYKIRFYSLIYSTKQFISHQGAHLYLSSKKC